VALILVAAVQLGRAALWPVSELTLSVAVFSLIAILAWRVNATWLVIAGAAAGWAWRFVR
jgi:chromate transport protein ChrA